MRAEHRDNNENFINLVSVRFSNEKNIKSLLSMSYEQNWLYSEIIFFILALICDKLYLEKNVLKRLKVF